MLSQEMIDQLVKFAKTLGVGSAELAVIKTLVEIGLPMFEQEAKEQWKLGGSILDIDTSTIPKVGQR